MSLGWRARAGPRRNPSHSRSWSLLGTPNERFNEGSASCFSFLGVGEGFIFIFFPKYFITSKYISRFMKRNESNRIELFCGTPEITPSSCIYTCTCALVHMSGRY